MSREVILNQIHSLIYNDKFKKTLSDSNGRDIVIFLGNTRAGKSTTVNYVIGNPLKGVAVGKRKFKIANATDNFLGPKIGMGSLSETSVPSAWPSSRLSELVVDAPGFDDNRGEAQDIANAFYIKELISRANTVKFVFISDINEILSDNVGQFIALMEKIHSILPQSTNLRSGMIIVFTKDEDDTTKDEICEMINAKILNQPSIRVSNRDLLKYFVDNRSHIVVVKMPIKEGVITDGDQIFVDLTEVIKHQAASLSRASLTTIALGISDRSRSFLLDARSHLIEFRQFDEVLRSVENSFNEHLKQYDYVISTIDQGNIQIGKLNELDQQLLSVVVSPTGAFDLLNSLRRIIPSASVLHDMSSFEIKMRFISFVDQLLQVTQSGIVADKVRNSTTNMRGAVQQYINRARTRVQALQEAEVAHRLAVEEERRRQEAAQAAELQRQNEENQRRIAELQRQQEEENRRRRRRKKCVLQ